MSMEPNKPIEAQELADKELEVIVGGVEAAVMLEMQEDADRAALV